MKISNVWFEFIEYCLSNHSELMGDAKFMHLAADLSDVIKERAMLDGKFTDKLAELRVVITELRDMFVPFGQEVIDDEDEVEDLDDTPDGERFFFVKLDKKPATMSGEPVFKCHFVISDAKDGNLITGELVTPADNDASDEQIKDFILAKVIESVSKDGL